MIQPDLLCPVCIQAYISTGFFKKKEIGTVSDKDQVSNKNFKNKKYRTQKKYLQ
jgi:hypothetical protein